MGRIASLRPMKAIGILAKIQHRSRSHEQDYLLRSQIIINSPPRKLPEGCFVKLHSSLYDDRQFHRAEFLLANAKPPGGGIRAGRAGRHHVNDDIGPPAGRDGLRQIIERPFVNLIAACEAVISIVAIPHFPPCIDHLPVRIEIRARTKNGFVRRRLRNDLTGKVPRRW